MNPEIIRIACSLSEADTEAKLLHEHYRAALNKKDEVAGRMVAALYEAEIWDPIAIALDDNEVLVCVWNGEDGYDFSLVLSYS